MSLDDFLKLGTFIVAAGGFIAGLYQYISGSKTKRSEFLDKLIKEFDAEDLLTAKLMLEDFDYKGLTKQKFKTILRYHSPNGVTDPNEQAIRKSFDCLLDFFVKINYLRENRLLSRKEISYFKYYLELAANDEHVVNYASVYGFEGFLTLKRKYLGDRRGVSAGQLALQS